MNRDATYLVLCRLATRHQALPFEELLRMAKQPTTETHFQEPSGPVTFFANVLEISPNAVQVNLSAISSSWWKLERMDESVTVLREDD